MSYAPNVSSWKPCFFSHGERRWVQEGEPLSGPWRLPSIVMLKAAAHEQSPELFLTNGTKNDLVRSARMRMARVMSLHGLQRIHNTACLLKKPKRSTSTPRCNAFLFAVSGNVLEHWRVPATRLCHKYRKNTAPEFKAAPENQNLVLKLWQLEMRTTLRGNRSECPDSSQLETAAGGSHIRKLSHVGVATRTDAAFLNNNC